MGLTFFLRYLIFGQKIIVPSRHPFAAASRQACRVEREQANSRQCSLASTSLEGTSRCYLQDFLGAILSECTVTNLASKVSFDTHDRKLNLQYRLGMSGSEEVRRGNH